MTDELRFEPMTEADLPEVTAVMTRAFDDDTQRHLGRPKGGPPGYDNGDFFRQWLFPYDESHGYKIVLDGQVVGGLIVWILPHGRNALGTIFVDPAVQDRGIGTRAWQWVEASWPRAKRWQLETPAFAVKNHHFYAKKCGFTRVAEKTGDEPGDTMYVYRKEMPGG